MIGIGGVVLLVVLVVGSILVWPFALSPKTGAAIGAVATAISAVVGLVAAAASAVAAVAAMKAATQSDETATRAIDALVYAIAPHLKLSFLASDIPLMEDEGRAVQLWNSSRWPATDVRVELKSHDGENRVFYLDVLNATGEQKDGSPIEPEMIQFPMYLSESMRDPDWRGEAEWVDTVIVTYSDERRLARWKVEFPYEYSVSATDKSTNGSLGPGAGWGEAQRMG